MFILEKIVPFIGIDFDLIVDSSRRSKISERKKVEVKRSSGSFLFFFFFFWLLLNLVLFSYRTLFSSLCYLPLHFSPYSHRTTRLPLPACEVRPYKRKLPTIFDGVDYSVVALGNINR